MINVYELRIGNWINGIDPQCRASLGPITVDSIESDGHINTWRVEGFGDESATELSGILLTPELLEACGFSAEKKTGTVKEFETYYVFTLGLFTYNSIHGWWYGKRNLDFQPKYLHQLQNLYFALTGEELTVKL